MTDTVKKARKPRAPRVVHPTHTRISFSHELTGTLSLGDLRALVNTIGTRPAANSMVAFGEGYAELVTR